MQETWKFHIKKLGPEASKKEWKSAICQSLKEEQKELGIFLSYFFRPDGAVVEEVELAGNIHFETPTSGNFKVKFRLIFYNACLNIHEKEKDKLTLSFTVDPEKNQITLISPYVPERGMDDI
ncbi:hypothetical protein QWY93_15795 [Echinicola jeungdonensis]|uniref:Uncharacterized protein n=1 Tax=Echinicola jeungdonensis TaxID=709343 RepID=A0ABV5J6X4_9BACT|nr:hypothetical protein [Echinicola jeungdonensis]MDN3670784.1 hypothetical protein [Echinicola jeungdonensis]